MCLESVLIDSLQYFTYTKAAFTILGSICKILAPKKGWQNGRIAQGNFCAHVALTSRSCRAHVALTSRSNTPKIGERILGAHIALTSRSGRAQMGKTCAQMGKNRALGAPWAHCDRIVFLSRKFRIFERDVSAVWAQLFPKWAHQERTMIALRARRERDVSASKRRSNGEQLSSV